MYSERDIFDPYEKHHSTVKDACELAEKLNIRNLLLYHTEDKDLDERSAILRKDPAIIMETCLFRMIWNQ